MPVSDPRDGFFYLPLTPMIDPKIINTPNLQPYNNYKLEARATVNY